MKKFWMFALLFISSFSSCYCNQEHLPDLEKIRVPDGGFQKETLSNDEGLPQKDTLYQVLTCLNLQQTKTIVFETQSLVCDKEAESKKAKVTLRVLPECRGIVELFKVSIANQGTKNFTISKLTSLPQRIDESGFDFELAFSSSVPGQFAAELTLGLRFDKTMVQHKIHLKGEAKEKVTVDEFFQKNASRYETVLVYDAGLTDKKEQEKVKEHLLVVLDFFVELSKFDFKVSLRVVPSHLQGCPVFLERLNPNSSLDYTKKLITSLKWKPGVANTSLESLSEVFYTTKHSGACGTQLFQDNALFSIMLISFRDDTSKITTKEVIKNIQRGFSKDVIDVMRGSVLGVDDVTKCKEKGYTSCEKTTKMNEIVKPLRGVQEQVYEDFYLGKPRKPIGSGVFSFFLSRTPRISTIKVVVNGKTVESAKGKVWRFDQHNNAIVFTIGNMPHYSSNIKVSYVAICLPP